ncbi:MAG: amidophosphoribosyltransferase [Desulfurococcaceae archaeon]|jgi:amidophosphoribosyltransferase|nr:MAG: amidophosphoribosyltransferase [Desulfurococcaceae archaeon]
MGGISACATGKPQNYNQAVKTALSILIELQHRGQETAGIATFNGDGSISALKRRSPASGLLKRLTSIKNGSEQKGFGCVAYVGGLLPKELIQPAVFGDEKFKIAVAFDGNITNYRDLHLIAKKIAPDTIPSHVQGESQAIAHAIYALAKEEKWDVVEALKRLPEYVVGAYSLVILTSEPRLVMARDPRGFKPLAYSYADKEIYVASETSALEVLGFDWRETGLGEILSFDGGSLEATTVRASVNPSPCVFEYVYISRPDSFFNGVSVYASRLKLGEYLAKEAPVDADIVVPVPDSGRIAAIGYSRASGIPLTEGIVINKYVGRVFISAPTRRDVVSKLKHGVIRSAVEGKRVVVVDDSIVRGTTLGFLLEKLRKGGARKLHLRISSPPFKCPCYCGVGVASGGELLAWGRSDIEEVRRSLGADSLAYNTLRNVELAVGLPSICNSCFTCRYTFSRSSYDSKTSYE